MRANRAVRPHDALQLRDGGGLIMSAIAFVNYGIAKKNVARGRTTSAGWSIRRCPPKETRPKDRAGSQMPIHRRASYRRLVFAIFIRMSKDCDATGQAILCRIWTQHGVIGWQRHEDEVIFRVGRD